MSYAEREELIPILLHLASGDANPSVRHAAAIGIDAASETVCATLGVDRSTHTTEVPKENEVSLPEGELLRMATSTVVGERTTAASIFGLLPQEDKDAGVEHYALLFSDADPHVREQAAASFTLLRLGRKLELVDLMVKLLEDAEHDVRDAAARATVDLTISGWPGLRTHAAEALHELARGDRSAHMKLYTCLMTDADPEVRAAAVATFADFTPHDRKDHLPLFLRRLSARETEGTVRLQAVAAVANLLPAERALCLRHIFRDIASLSVTGRIAVVHMVANLSQLERLPYMSKFIGLLTADPSAEVRDAVFHSFSRLTNEEQHEHEDVLLR
jgi:HEAT repeat protein